MGGDKKSLTLDQVLVLLKRPELINDLKLEAQRQGNIDKFLDLSRLGRLSRRHTIKELTPAR